MFLIVTFVQDSHIVQLFFKHTKHKSSIVEEIRRRDGERSFFLFDPGIFRHIFIQREELNILPGISTPLVVVAVDNELFG